MRMCLMCGSDRIGSGEVWSGDYADGPDYVEYCLCCGYGEYI